MPHAYAAEGEMRRLPFVIVLLLLGLTGCASSPMRTGYLRNYDRLERGRHLDRYWADSRLVAQRKYSKVRLGGIDVGRISNGPGVTTEDCKAWFRGALGRTPSALSGHLVFDDAAPAQLDVAITEMTPGSAGARMFAGELGMGHAWVQAEGRVIDRQSQEELVAWSDRRRSSAAIGFRDLGGDAGPTLVREMLEQIAIDLEREL